MMGGTFTTPFQLLYLSVATAFFGALAAITQPRRRRLLGVLASVVVFTLLSAPLDTLARHAGWWSYPSCVDPPHPPLLVYIGQALIFVGGVALIGEPVHRRWGARGLATLAVLVCSVGLVRDFSVAAILPGMIEFGSFPSAPLADLGAWLVVVVVALGVSRLVGGAPATTSSG